MCEKDEAPASAEVCSACGRLMSGRGPQAPLDPRLKLRFSDSDLDWFTDPLFSEAQTRWLQERLLELHERAVQDAIETVRQLAREGMLER